MASGIHTLLSLNLTSSSPPTFTPKHPQEDLMLHSRRYWGELPRQLTHKASAHTNARPNIDHLNAIITHLPEPTPSTATKTPHQPTTHNASPSTPPPALQNRHIAIKDNIATPCAPTTAASHALKTYTSPFPSTVSQLLSSHGAHLTSKTNLDEFAMGSHSQSSHFGPVRGPLSPAHSPGGSSGGSAVAVATAHAWAALGTDTGGSVRVPAAYTGVVGFKPSYGRVSRWGVLAYAHSLDTVGVLARRVRDAALVFSVLDAHDPKDPTSLSPALRRRLPPLTPACPAPAALRIGIPREAHITSLCPAVLSTYKALLSRLQRAGHTLHPVSLPTTRAALPAYYILAPAEASSNLARYDGVRYGPANSSSSSSPVLYAPHRAATLGPEPRRRILLGAYTLSAPARDAHFLHAQRIRRMVQAEFDGVFTLPNPLHNTPPAPHADSVDILLLPTVPSLPPRLPSSPSAPVRDFLTDVFTVPSSLAGLPAASVPVAVPGSGDRDGSGDGDVDADVRTAGMQVVGQFGDDAGVLAAAAAVEAVARASG